MPAFVIARVPYVNSGINIRSNQCTACKIYYVLRVFLKFKNYKIYFEWTGNYWRNEI